MGTERTRLHGGKADVVLFVLDGSAPIAADDLSIFQEFREKEMVLVLNKSDLPPVLDVDCLPEQMKGYTAVSVSAKYRENITGLKRALRDCVLDRETPAGTPSVIINRIRHKVSLERAMVLVDQAIQGLTQGLSVEFIALDVREALDSLGEVVGETTAEEILDRIFSEFCIGK
jgi:tRNA modification GTPase